MTQLPLIVVRESVSKAPSGRYGQNMTRSMAYRVLIGVLLVLAVAAAVIWVARRPIADAAIRRAIASRGVAASYTVKSIGLRWERIENLRIGDPTAPDLTADWADIRVSAGLNGVKLRGVRAGGVRLRGRIVNGRLTLGDIDKLLKQDDVATPVVLPDLDVELIDARVSIDSRWAQVGARIDGKGNLVNGFSGKIAAIGNALQVSGCRADRATAYVDVSIANRRPTFRGPLRAAALTCEGFAIANPALSIAATLGTGLDRWRGEAALLASGFTTNQATLTALAGRIVLDGNFSGTKGTAALSAATGRVDSTPFSGVTFSGNYAIGSNTSTAGRFTVDRVAPDIRLIAQLDRAARTTVGTPIGALLAQLARAARRAVAGISVVADGSYSGGTAEISRFDATSASGASLRATGGRGIRFGAAGFVADTTLSLSGGGFPTMRSTLQRRSDGMTVGIAQLSPFVGGGSRVALEPVRFAANPSGAMRFETVATLDGPVSGGRVEGLRLPVNATIAANGAIIVNNGCTPFAFLRLSISGLVLKPSRLRLCPADGRSLFRYEGGRIAGGAIVTAPRLIGTLGTTAVALAANEARVLLGRNGFTIASLSARLGSGERLSTIEIGSMDGRFVDGAVRGRFGNTAGKIGNVPLLMTDAAGSWTLRNGALALRGGLTVSDELVPGRFNPLMSDDAVLRLVDGQIAATATLREPVSRTAVTSVVIGHNLSAGTGTAALDVAELRFGKTFQPEQITRLTLGVVANVNGTVSGRGNISWNPGGVKSTGRFTTQALDFAAAFGPVSGLKGDIYFDDLLAMATPPGQRVTIASINPGTLVTNGAIVYQLLPGQRVAIERGDWPFAGGDLILDPTSFAFGQDATRKLTFRVVGLDAAKFIQQLEFENLAATGIFDGILPMYFNANGGRIEGGRLVVRQGGGTLAYVGEISNAAMNVYAELAFDALKSIRYDKLTIELNGALDGEIVSQIDFNGINEAPLSPPKSYIARQFIGLPFIFNIKVTAPFRSLLNTARTFQDPSSLLQRSVPELRKPPVQPPESETRP